MWKGKKNDYFLLFKMLSCGFCNERKWRQSVVSHDTIDAQLPPVQEAQVVDAH